MNTIKDSFVAGFNLFMSRAMSLFGQPEKADNALKRKKPHETVAAEKSFDKSKLHAHSEGSPGTETKTNHPRR